MRFSALNLNSAQKFLLSAAAAAALVLASTPISAQDQDDIPNAGRLGYVSGNVSIEPAGVDPLPPGGEIPNTQGSVDLMTLFASFARQNNNSGANNSAAQAPQPQGTAP